MRFWKYLKTTPKDNVMKINLCKSYNLVLQHHRYPCKKNSYDILCCTPMTWGAHSFYTHTHTKTNAPVQHKLIHTSRDQLDNRKKEGRKRRCCTATGNAIYFQIWKSKACVEETMSVPDDVVVSSLAGKTGNHMVHTKGLLSIYILHTFGIVHE